MRSGRPRFIDDLQGLLDRARNDRGLASSDPLARLSSIKKLQLEIRQRVEWEIDYNVRSARSMTRERPRAISFERIGRVLGVTKQAAMSRHKLAMRRWQPAATAREGVEPQQPDAGGGRQTYRPIQHRTDHA